VTMNEIMISSLDKLECVKKFCYLGDLIGAGGGAEKTSRARGCCTWAKSRELTPMLTSRVASVKVKRKVYRACIQGVLRYASETLGYESGGYGKIGKSGTNDGQVGVWCSHKE